MTGGLSALDEVQKRKRKKAAALTLVCPSVTVRGTLVEGHLFLGGKGLSQFHKTTIWTGKSTMRWLMTSWLQFFIFCFFLNIYSCRFICELSLPCVILQAKL